MLLFLSSFMHIPNLKHLHVLCAVADFQSISKASEAVFLSQSAVTQAIAKLSQELGTPLIIRKSRGVALTRQAEAYVNRVKRSLAILKYGLIDVLRMQDFGIQKSDYLFHHLTNTQLKAFITVAETSNYTHAAKKIGTSQSSVYRSIQELQHLLNLKLFEKTSLGLKLSKIGLIFYQSCKLATAELAQGEMEIRMEQNLEVGKIVIGSMPLVRHEVLPKAINLFSDSHPKVNIKIVESSYESMLEQLQLGEIDFLIGALREIEESTGIAQERLFDATLCIVADKNHPLSYQDDVRIDELMRYTWVLPARETPTRKRFESMVSSNGEFSNEPTVIECSSMALVRGLLMESSRLALISRQQAGLEFDFNLFAKINYDFNDTPRAIGLTFRHDWIGLSIHNNFLDCLRKVSQNQSLND
ncbi:Transcriptional regulator associated with utilization of aromatic, LysR family [Moraxella catarrhalis]|uniref:Transcriptional regulator associated with utilization of aromatic, LysR family n=2 Tax=Moraxella catarrhalis TaxID=480 RepID=A0A198UE06_MORCA|nr:Transcriptional regulator associated with utilization of aromatic, LysR family [Moraxella catarrhalis]OAU98697.1 Transcriptional regulator associated with utilization of aromatic, LysR family [Moraxella catarrhalis]OAV04494.1 Transcriptional regulator associated with utilization of aromatic, LysR family [Moraxella catarrhalis]